MTALPSGVAFSVLGLGSDIIEVERIQHAYERHRERFLDRVYTQEEQDYCLGIRNPYPHLAARFAAKEAISKCFGTGIGADFGWTSASIGKGLRDEPYVILDQQAQKLLKQIGGRKVLVSLSHTRSLGQAVALITQ